jgi:DNA-binding Xre family transcriptional regulator
MVDVYASKKRQDVVGMLHEANNRIKELEAETVRLRAYARICQLAINLGMIAELQTALAPFAAIPPVAFEAKPLGANAEWKPLKAAHYWCVAGHPTKSHFTREDLQRAKEALKASEAYLTGGEPPFPVLDATVSE